MPDQDQTIRDCLAERVWAVVGASRDPARYGHKVFLSLVAAGYQAYPINPSAPDIAGHSAYPSLAALPERPGVVDTVVPPATTLRVVEEAAALGIGLVWMQPGSESEEAIALAESKGLRVVHHACAMLGARRGAAAARDYQQEG